MYSVEFHCSKCDSIYEVGQSVTFKGKCPRCQISLDIEFKTIGNKNA